MGILKVEETKQLSLTLLKKMNKSIFFKRKFTNWKNKKDLIETLISYMNNLPTDISQITNFFLHLINFFLFF